jgi:hypothetical protein
VRVLGAKDPLADGQEHRELVAGADGVARQRRQGSEVPPRTGNPPLDKAGRSHAAGEVSPENEALVRQIRALLPAPEDEPMSTSEIRGVLGLGVGEYDTVLRQLDRLARQGEAEKIKRPTTRTAYWRQACVKP